MAYKFRRASRQTLDGVAARPLPRQSVPSSDTTSTAPTQQKAAETPKKHRFDIKTGLLMVAGVLFGATIFTYQPIAELLLCLFGVLAIIKRISSQTIFTLAFIALAVVPLAAVTGRLDVGLAFSSYAFLLLVFATISLGREVAKRPLKRSAMHHKN